MKVAFVCVCVYFFRFFFQESFNSKIVAQFNLKIVMDFKKREFLKYYACSVPSYIRGLYDMKHEKNTQWKYMFDKVNNFFFLIFYMFRDFF